jgi:hypothetical protein
MFFYKLLPTVLFLLACIPGQSQSSDDDVLGVVAIMDNGKITDHGAPEKREGHSVYLTVAGFVTITPGPVGAPRLAYRGYYILDPTKAPEKKTLEQGVALQIYLKVGQEYCVEAENTRGKVEPVLFVRRVRRVPNILLGYRPNGNSKAQVFVNNADTTRRLQLPADDVVVVEAKATDEFADAKIEFSLVNLETKQTEHHIEKFDFADLSLKPGTEYQLRFNYVIQPESVAVYYVQVKPRWYRRPITYVVVGILLIAGIFWGVTGRLKRKIRSSQKKQQKLEEAAIRLQSMLNPHFTFNALSSIQGLMNTDRIEEANHYLQEFSGLLRKTLNTSQHVFNTLDRELDMMSMYLRLEALRFNFSWTVHIAEGLDTTVIEIPTLILQPLIENSVKHGISRLGGQGQLAILCKPGTENGNLVIVIQDNGTWQNKASGYGLSLTEERLRAINQLKKEQRIELTFRKQSGTEAILTFHHWLNT